jgi:hypothetical protein
MLELEGYEVGGSSFGGSFTTTGGKAMGTAGTPLLPSAGRPSTPTIDQCAQYCSGYAKTCAQELNGRDCERVCEAEMDGFGAKCQVLGLSAIQCLTPFFRPGSGSCDAATRRGLAGCGSALANFKACETNTPTPMLDPADPSTCPSMGGISPASCDVTFACSRRVYRTGCSLSTDRARAHCFCDAGDSGFAGDIETNDLSLACALAALQCPPAAIPGP